MTVDTGTRGRIQQVALELFTEQGYEKTSLREIAERLGVSKAALYYHFKSKEEIVESFVADPGAAVEELLDWARRQPRTAQLRRELLRRYADVLFSHRHMEIVRFFECNQAALRGTPVGEKLHRRIGQLMELVVDHDAPLTAQIRAGMALWALHAGWFVIRDPQVTNDERRAAALEVALDLVSDELVGNTDADRHAVTPRSR